jgi:hypothetical protein
VQRAKEQAQCGIQAQEESEPMNKAVYQNSASEAQIQRAIVEYLTAKGVPHSVTNASIHFENGKPRRRVGTDGWFDVTAVLTRDGIGLFWGIEVKSATGKLRPSQIALHARVRLAGGVVTIARSVDDIVEMF